MNLSGKLIFFRAPRGRHGPKLKIRKHAKKLSAAAFKKKNFKNLYCPKGPLQHMKNLSDHFLISESYRENRFFTALQKQILEFDLF
jgi:hypothetical protein